jgi:peptide/nickel transport system substrate-binding protein
MLTSHFIYPSQVGDEAVTFGNPRLNELIASALTLRTDDEREDAYSQIFKEMYDQAACVPLYYCEDIYAMSSKVRGFEFGPDDYEPIIWGKLWISK